MAIHKARIEGYGTEKKGKSVNKLRLDANADVDGGQNSPVYC